MIDVAKILRDHRDFEGARHLVDVEGMSDPKVCNLLNRLVAAMPAEQTYLEIGTWKGLTLISAAFENQGKRCVACDKFRLWGRYTGFGPSVRAAFHRNVERYRGRLATIELYEMRSLDLFRRGLVRGPVGVFFYDGDHSYRGTRDNLVAAAPLLSDRAVLLVDDWKDPTIRAATRQALADAGLAIEWERWLGEGGVGRDFWNGLGVFVLVRPASRARTLADADVQRVAAAGAAPG